MPSPRRRPRVLALLLALGSMSACRSGEGNAPAPPASSAPAFRQDGTLSIAREGRTITTLAIEIADTDSTRERGLMERAPLPDTQGMLFVFPTAGPQSFWMANTPSSLDILFIAPDSTLLNVAKYTKPFSSDAVPSQGAAQYVLEVRAGLADQLGLAPGDRIAWRRSAAPSPPSASP